MKRVTYLIIILFILIFNVTAQVDRSKAPQSGPAPKVLLGEYSKFELPNGLKVFVVEDHRLPRVTFSISLIIDPPLEGVNTGIGNLTSQLIGTGTKTRTKDQIDEELDFISGSLSASPNGLYAASLKKHIQKLLDIFSDVTINSSFKKEELEKKRTQSLSNLASNKDDPNFIADNVSSALIYGKNNPYGEFETETSLKSITLDMCDQYYKEYFKPNIACLSIVGDITPDEAKSLVTKYFGTWTKGVVKSQSYPKPQPPLTTKVELVDRPQSVQSIIEIGYPVDINPGSPDYIKTMVANTVLGGGVFRLFLNLREKHAYTYGAYSRFSINPLVSCFRASTSARNAVTDSAVSQILYEMKRLREEPVPENELTRVKNYMTGNFALSLEKPQTIASFAVNTERYKLPKDFYSNYLKSIEAVNATDIQQMAMKYILPDRSNIIIVGKASDIAEKIKRFSPENKVEYYDVNGSVYDPTKLLKPVPSGINAQSVFDKYLKSIGGLKNIDKIKNVTMKANMNIQNMKANILVIYKNPDKYLTEIKLNEQTVQKMVLNGNVGKSYGMQGNKDLKGEELEKLKMDAELFPELKYQKLGYKIDLKGIGEVNGKEAYILEITSPSNSLSTDYYSVESGLKIKTITNENSPMGKTIQTTDLEEYTEVNGVKFPKIIKQSAGPQVYEITVESIEINSNLKDNIFE
jgi:zinc protease